MAERESFTPEFSYENGQDVNVTVEYDVGKGVGGVLALQDAGKQYYLHQLLASLAEDGDPSVREAIRNEERKRAEAAREEDDDYDGDYWDSGDDDYED